VIEAQLLGAYWCKLKGQADKVYRRVYRIVRTERSLKEVNIFGATPGGPLRRSDIGRMLCVDDGIGRLAFLEQEASILRSMERHQAPEEQHMKLSREEATLLERYLRTGRTDGKDDRKALQALCKNIQMDQP